MTQPMTDQECLAQRMVNGVPGGIAWAPGGRPFAVLSFTVAGGRIVSMDVLADPDRLSRLDLGRFGSYP